MPSTWQTNASLAPDVTAEAALCTCNLILFFTKLRRFLRLMSIEVILEQDGAEFGEASVKPRESSILVRV